MENNKRIENKINKIYAHVYNQVFKGQNLTNLSNGNREDIMLSLNSLEASNKYNLFAKKFAEELARAGLNKVRGVWRKYYKIAKKMHYVALPPSYKEYEFDIYSEAVKNNFKMIKTIPSQIIKILNHNYTSTLIEEVAKGKINRGSFRKQLAEHGHKNANVIARTETAKLQTIITKTAAVDIGSVAYIWLSSHDSRTRPSHRMMNKVVVFWRDYMEKPLLDKMQGDAGEFPNCRCDAQPIIDLEDLKDAYYNVYDYKQKRIVRMSNRTLKYFLMKGEL